MEEKEAEVMWKRGGTLGKGSYGFVSLAFTDTDSSMNVPSVIAVKSYMLLNHSFLKIVDMVQPPEFTRKRPGSHSMYFSRLRQNKALRRQTHVRDMVTKIGADSESGNPELGIDSEGRNSEVGADSERENSELGADSEGGNSSQSC
ncbi:hypothetical protein H5410_006565 [Solanum commersonii]|uniref:Uncharacterized protein n=1 Tax=Solanum commersonii TaxID=4109 RepID=A0A9J6AAM8_SOLCO|nr:hypothetical protein H5410_006565 [Solanum commersonii]